jgi:hypothetical protein
MVRTALALYLGRRMVYIQYRRRHRQHRTMIWSPYSQLLTRARPLLHTRNNHVQKMRWNLLSPPLKREKQLLRLRPQPKLRNERRRRSLRRNP